MNKYTFKIYPKGRGRTVYRVIETDGLNSLNDLCGDILNAFDFDHDHLYEFCMDNKMYSDGLHYSYEESDEITIDDLKLTKSQNFSLHYDFGDDWMFVIHVNKIEPCDLSIDTKIIREKGTLEQYPYYDEFE